MAQHNTQIEQFLAELLPQAPQVLHDVFAQDGANEVLTSLKTAESKVAYLIQMIALELHKASKEIDLKKLTDGPDDVKFHIIRTAKFFTSTPFTITILELSAFADLYYATCAKLKELLQGVDVRLANGFKCSTDDYFEYHCPRLEMLEPVSVGDFKASLLIYETILYSSQLTEPLNKAVLKKSMRDNKDANRKQPNSVSGEMFEQTEHVKDDLDQTLEHNEKRAQLRHGVFQNNLRWLRGISGLQDTKNLNCSMINATLTEKYRSLLSNAEFQGSSIPRQPTPDAPQLFEETESLPTYISPYNLEERAKKLNVPGGPEMPCICDPDCVCAPVCASDPTQNCLCEENGLFARVTEGMDIDELDVPDLVRRKRQGSQTSGSSAASLLDTETYPESTNTPNNYTAYENRLDHDYMVTDGLEMYRQTQHYQAPNNTNLTDTMTMSDMLESSELDEHEFCGGRGSMPLRVSSLAYRDALRQPFSKECDHPPKRASVTQRLFSSRNHGFSAKKTPPVLDKRTKGQNSNVTLGKVVKQTTKRSIADMSFASFKHALRRKPHLH